VVCFSLDRKATKDQGCKSLAKYFIRTTEKIKLSRLLSKNFECGIRQQFSLFVVLIHIFNAKYLRPINNKYAILLRCGKPKEIVVFYLPVFEVY
jgi:hypothetical protein